MNCVLPLPSTRRFDQLRCAEPELGQNPTFEGLAQVSKLQSARMVHFRCFQGANVMRWALRILGSLNIIASVLSLSYFAWLIEIHLGHWPGDPNRREWIVFLGISAVSVSLVVYLAYLGVRLIQRDLNALGLASLVFVLEIALCFVDFMDMDTTAPGNPKQYRVVLGNCNVPTTVSGILWLRIGWADCSSCIDSYRTKIIERHRNTAWLTGNLTLLV